MPRISYQPGLLVDKVLSFVDLKEGEIASRPNLFQLLVYLHWLISSQLGLNFLLRIVHGVAEEDYILSTM